MISISIIKHISNERAINSLVNILRTVDDPNHIKQLRNKYETQFKEEYQIQMTLPCIQVLQVESRFCNLVEAVSL